MHVHRPYRLLLSVVTLLSLCLLACQGERFFAKHGFIKSDSTIDMPGHTNRTIEVHYIGCSGFFIKRGEDILLIDPYFSFNSADIILRRPKHRDDYVSWEMDNIFTRSIGTNKDTSGKIDALLIGHAHVDHYGDVPYLYRQGYLKDTIRIIGNNNVGHYSRPFRLNRANIVAGVEDSAQKGRWIQVNDHIRVLPILSEHAPHFLGFSFAADTHENKDTKHLFSLRYGSGQTLCYLIDFLNDKGDTEFRIYHNSAGNNPGKGCLPQPELDAHAIDLAILCAASCDEVSCYPEDVIRHLTPRHVLFSHWEDFLFHSLADIRSSPTGNCFYTYNKLFRRTDTLVDSLRKKGMRVDYNVPNVDTKVTFHY